MLVCVGWPDAFSHMIEIEIMPYLCRAILCASMTCIASGSVAAAELKYPISVAAAADGTIYVADNSFDFHAIWKIRDGQLEVFFEASRKFRTPLNAVRCVAVDAKGRLIAGDSATREVYRFNEGNKPEPLTSGSIGIPMAVAFNSSGDLLVCNLELHQIVRVPEAGGKPEVVAELMAPRGIAVDSQDRAWVVMHGKDRQVARIGADGKVETIVEGRPFQFPHTIALDAEQNAYIADGYGKAIWKVAPGGKPEKWTTSDTLINPVGVCWHNDRLLIADPRARGIFASGDGKLTRIAPAPDAK
jgi:sugar lactone lactonase YvrE